jgi:hypothetical protein
VNKSIIQKSPTNLKLRKTNQQKHKTALFTSSHVCQIGHSIAEIGLPENPCTQIDDAFYEKFVPIDPTCTFEWESCNQKSMT